MRRSSLVMSLAAACVATCLVPAHATFRDDNGRIAFRRYLDADQDTGAVFTVRPNGTDEFQVTHPPEGYVDRNPDVSPDGRRIVFQRSGPTMDDIFVVNSDGTQLRQLTNTAYPEGNCLPKGASATSRQRGLPTARRSSSPARSAPSWTTWWRPSGCSS